MHNALFFSILLSMLGIVGLGLK